MPAFAVLGATSWGVTLAWLLARGSTTVTLLVRDESEAHAVTARRGIPRLPEVTLPPTVGVELAAGFTGRVDGLVVAVPSQSLRASVSAFRLPRTVPVVSGVKGIESETGRRMSEVLVDCGWAPGLVSALSGPNLAHEIARGLPAAAVIACTDEGHAAEWQRALSVGSFRAYRSADIIGVELAGALKNVIAVAAGAAAGLGFGANTVAAIVTRGLAEMSRLGVALGAKAITFQGLAGVGDLAATCFSPLSRNRRLGELLAAGEGPAEALALIGETVEGATTAPIALSLARRHGVDVPITEQVTLVLRGESTVPAAVLHLLSRTLKQEAEQEAGP